MIGDIRLDEWPNAFAPKRCIGKQLRHLVGGEQAQVKHLNQLRQEAQQAQAAMVRYVGYLLEEHEVPNDGSWQLGADCFEPRVMEQAEAQ